MDYWFGRPACWVLTTVFKLKRIFVKKNRIEHTRKILFIKLFGIGSIVLALPAIKALEEDYPDSEIFFLTFKGNEEILRLTGVVDEKNIFTVRTGRITLLIRDLLTCVPLLVKEKIDIAIDMEFFSRFTAILSFFIRSRYRIGFYGFHTEGLKRGSFINFPIQYNHTIHTARAFFTLLKPLGITGEKFNPTPPQIPASVNFHEKIIEILSEVTPTADLSALRKWMIINPNTSDLIELRKWPESNFSEVANYLLEQFKDLGVIFIGSPSESKVVESIMGMMQSDNLKRTFNTLGKTSIRDLLDLFYFAELFLTNDSGPAHLASLTNIPMVVLFGPETPDLYAPLGNRARCLYLGLDCQPCVSTFNAKRSFCQENICLQEITPEKVGELCFEMITSSSKTREFETEAR